MKGGEEGEGRQSGSLPHHRRRLPVHSDPNGVSLTRTSLFSGSRSSPPSSVSERMRLLVVFAAVIAAVAAEVYFEERFEDGGTCNLELQHKIKTLG